MYNVDLILELESKLSKEEIDLELIDVFVDNFTNCLIHLIPNYDFKNYATILTLMAKSMKLGMYYNKAEQANQTNPKTISENN